MKYIFLSLGILATIHINAMTPVEQNLLHAITTGDIQRFHELIEAGANLQQVIHDQPSRVAYSLVRQIVQQLQGKPNFAQELISAGVHINRAIQWAQHLANEQVDPQNIFQEVIHYLQKIGTGVPAATGQ